VRAVSVARSGEWCSDAFVAVHGPTVRDIYQLYGHGYPLEMWCNEKNPPDVPARDLLNYVKWIVMSGSVRMRSESCNNTRIWIHDDSSTISVRHLVGNRETSEAPPFS